MWGALLLLAGLLDPGPRARIDVDLLTEVHASSALPGELGPDALRGGDLQPAIGVRLDDRAFQLQSRFAPRLLASGHSILAVREEGSLDLRWQRSRSLTLVGGGRFGYGRSAFNWDPGTRRPFDSIENVLPLIRDQLSVEGELGFTFAAARGVTVVGSAGYSANGGASARSQQLIPLQRGPQIYAAVVQDLSRTDQLTTDVYASRTTRSGGRVSSVVKATGAWSRQIEVATRASASVGASLDRGAGSGGGKLFPVGSAALDHEVPARSSRLELRANALVGPHYSLATADLQQRAEVGASVRWVFRNDLSVRGRAAVAREIGDGSRAGSLLIGAFDVGLRLGPHASLSAGLEQVRQRLPSDVSAAPSAWFAFAALTAGARDIL